MDALILTTDLCVLTCHTSGTSTARESGVPVSGRSINSRPISARSTNSRPMSSGSTNSRSMTGRPMSGRPVTSNTKLLRGDVTSLSPVAGMTSRSHVRRSSAGSSVGSRDSIDTSIDQSRSSTESADTCFKPYELLWRRSGVIPLPDVRNLVAEFLAEKYDANFFRDNTDRQRSNVCHMLIQLGRKRDRHVGHAPAYMRCLLESLRTYAPTDRRVEIFALIIGLSTQPLRPCLCDMVLDLLQGLVIGVYGQLDPRLHGTYIKKMLCTVPTVPLHKAISSVEHAFTTGRTASLFQLTVLKKVNHGLTHAEKVAM